MTRKICSLLLACLLVLGCLPGLQSVRAEPTTATVVACSDFQNYEDSASGGYSGSYTNNVALVKRLFSAMGYESIDGFLVGGDYNFPETINNVSGTQTGLEALRDTVQELYPDLPRERMVFVQGNHDAAGTPGLASTGAYETEAYSVYAINEDDYMDRNSNETVIRQTAEKLGAYLKQKADDGYDHPIFVITHLPLHFTTRTQKNGDGMYAHDLFDLLNEYGEQLNIIFLFGHNHAYGYDSYMGGSTIFLQRGDLINIADRGSRSTFRPLRLNFTYMNCGYIGYYWFNYNPNGNHVTDNPPAESVMTMTSFEITGNDVVIHRWDENGLHDLKAAGARITRAINGTDYEDTWEPNTLTYGPTAEVGAPAPPVAYSDGAATVYTTVPIEGIHTTSAQVPGLEAEDAAFEIRPTQPLPEGTSVTVTLRVPAELAKSSGRLTLQQADGPRELAFIPLPDPEDAAFGLITFRTDALGVFAVQRQITGVYERVTDLSGLPETGSYLLLASNTHKNSGASMDRDYLMLPTPKYVDNNGAEVPLTSAYRTGFALRAASELNADAHPTLYAQTADCEWTLASEGEHWLLRTPEGGVTFAYRDDSAATVTLSDAPTPLSVAKYGSTDTFVIGTASAVGGVTYYLDYNTRGLVCGYKAHNNDIHFYLYRRTGTEDSPEVSWLAETVIEAEGLPAVGGEYAGNWKRLTQALADAKRALAEEKDQTRINAAWIALRQAIDKLMVLPEPENPFKDVTEDDYFFDPVIWAFNHDPQITTGTDGTHYSPDDGCTRAQVVTFLWRAAGKPAAEGQTNPFKDVPPREYYTEAVLWAVKNGITTGTEPDEFSPEETCSRAQIVTFLWRYKEKPDAEGADNPFKDVPAGEYYTEAVLWAVEKGITKGTDADRFSPNDTCTRGQIVTFLFREMKG